MLKLKLQYFGHLMLKTDSLEQTLGLYLTLPLLGKGRLVENHCYCCYSNLDHTTLWALLPTMPCEFCNPEVDSILSCGWQEG